MAQADTKKATDNCQTLKKPKLDQLDNALYTWFSAKRSEGKPITGPMVIEKAKQFSSDLNVKEGDCKFSRGWLHNFKTRHGIRKLDFSGESKSADEAAANEFKVTFGWTLSSLKIGFLNSLFLELNKTSKNLVCLKTHRLFC